MQACIESTFIDKNNYIILRVGHYAHSKGYCGVLRPCVHDNYDVDSAGLRYVRCRPQLLPAEPGGRVPSVRLRDVVSEE